MEESDEQKPSQELAAMNGLLKDALDANARKESSDETSGTLELSAPTLVVDQDTDDRKAEKGNSSADHGAVHLVPSLTCPAENCSPKDAVAVVTDQPEGVDAGAAPPISPAASSISQPQKRLGAFEVFCYAYPSFSIGGLVVLLATFLIKFYADVFLIEVQTLGLIGMVILVIHALSQPVMGSLSDDVKSDFGRRKTFIRFFWIPLCLSYFCAFCPPPSLEKGAVTIWLFLMAPVLAMSWGTCECMRLSLAAVLAPEYRDRNRLMGAVAAAFIAGVLVASAAPGILDIVNDNQSRMSATDCSAGATTLTCDEECRKHEILKFRIVGGFFASSNFIEHAIFLWVIREPQVIRIDGVQSKKSCALIKQLRQNRLSNRFLGIFGCIFSSGAVIATIVPFYAASVIRPPFSVSWYPFILSAIGLIFIPFWVKISQTKMEKRTVVQLSSAMNVIGYVCAMFFKPGDWVLLLILVVVLGVFFGGNLFVPTAMMPDIQDYGELLNGLREEGAYLGWWTIVARISAAFSIGLCLAILGVAGYVEGTDCQTDNVVNVLGMIVGLAPSGLLIGGLLMLWKYPMNAEMHTAVMAIVNERHAGKNMEVQCPMYCIKLAPWPAELATPVHSPK